MTRGPLAPPAAASTKIGNLAADGASGGLPPPPEGAIASGLPQPEDFILDDPKIQVDPYAYYPVLREQKPVLKTMAGGDTWWVLSRQEDVVRALMDPQTFSSRTLPDASILFLDPPEHDRLRAIAAPWFSRAAVHLLSGPIEEHAETIIKELAEAGACDAVTDLAMPLTITMISGMLGIKAEAVQSLRNLRLLRTGLLAYLRASRLGVEPSPEACAAMDEINSVHDSIIDGELSADGVVADLVRHMANGDITRPECRSYISILFGAGHSTTTDLIGNSFFTLATRRGDLDRIAHDKVFTASFVEEVLRTRPSFHRIPRITTQDVEIGGEHIPEGSLVRLLLASANRDPAMFEDPETFDPDKKRRMHLAFGKGIHTCLGSWLARLEATIALQVLSRHVTVVELDPDHASSPHTGGTFNGFGFEQLPVLLRSR